MKEEKITVLVVEPGKPAQRREIENTVKAFQEVVGGYFELGPSPIDHVRRICNEDGLRLNLPKNRDLVGTWFFVGDKGDEEFHSLTEPQLGLCKSLVLAIDASVRRHAHAA